MKILLVTPVNDLKYKEAHKFRTQRENAKQKWKKKYSQDGRENENYHEKCYQHGVQIQQIMICTKITLKTWK